MWECSFLNFAPFFFDFCSNLFVCTRLKWLGDEVRLHAAVKFVAEHLQPLYVVPHIGGLGPASGSLARGHGDRRECKDWLFAHSHLPIALKKAGGGGGGVLSGAHVHLQ